MTIRLDPSVIEAARGRAQTENRTLTNYIETVLRRDLGLLAPVGAAESPEVTESEAPITAPENKAAKTPGGRGPSSTSR